MSGVALHPPVLWAQRKESLFVTIDLQDVQNPKVNVDNREDGKVGVLTFSGTVNGPDGVERYEMELELAHGVTPAETKISATPRNVFIVIPKKEHAFWERLQRKAGKVPYVKVDWNKWVDEDDAGDAKDPFDMSAIENFTGLDGMDEDESEDSDDEDEAPESKEPEAGGSSEGKQQVGEAADT